MSKKRFRNLGNGGKQYDSVGNNVIKGK